MVPTFEAGENQPNFSQIHQDNLVKWIELFDSQVWGRVLMIGTIDMINDFIFDKFPDISIDDTYDDEDLAQLLDDGVILSVEVNYPSGDYEYVEFHFYSNGKVLISFYEITKEHLKVFLGGTPKLPKKFASWRLAIQFINMMVANLMKVPEFVEE